MCLLFLQVCFYHMSVFDAFMLFIKAQLLTNPNQGLQLKHFN